MITKSNTDLETVPGTRLIYESPDGGKTIYAREIGSDKRVLMQEDSLAIARQKTALRANRLLSILLAAETDTTLKDALETLEALYIIKYGDDENS